MKNKYVSKLFIEKISVVPMGDLEREVVKKFRRSNSYMWFYHGTKADDETIKNEGLKMTIASRGMINIGKSGENRELIGKKLVWLTSIKSHAMLYIQRTGFKQIWKREKGKVLLIRVNTKGLIYSCNVGELGDEYVYPKDISPKDILFPEDPKYKQVERKFKYLQELPE